MTLEAINQTLEAFKINASCKAVKQHRHFIFYDLELRPGCRINKIQNCAQELALVLKKTTPIIKLIPEKGILRLQMTSGVPDTLFFSELYKKYQRPSGLLPFLLGETDEGNPLWVDFNTNPHLLVAGSTGSGKSVLLHNLIANASKFDDVVLFLIDTKRVEFQKYEQDRMSNLVPVVAKDYDSAIYVLQHLLEVMEYRYETLSALGFNSIEQKPNLFNKILVLIDEVADLIAQDKGKIFEKLVNRLAAKARAAGIYLVLATQRPSVEVLTGDIKANFSGRLACKVYSKTDSQVVLDQLGAQELIGRGDAIFKNPIINPTRLQVAYAEADIIIKNYLKN